jgi:hypothetical protein
MKMKIKIGLQSTKIKAIKIKVYHMTIEVNKY